MSDDPTARAGEIEELLRRLSAGEPSVRGVQSGRGDVFDRVIEGINGLAAELESLRALRDRANERLNQLLDVVVAIAARSYAKRAHVEGNNDLFDGLAIGLNMMVDELIASTSLTQDILASMDDAVITLDLDGVITSANEAALELLGYTDEGLRWHPLSLVLAGPQGRRGAAELLEALGTQDDEGARLTASDGRQIPVSLSASALRDARGGLVGAVCVARDITERLRSEVERDRLQEALRLQAAAILEMSTPLIPITEEIVVMPLVGSVDPGRADQVLDTLLRGVDRYHARVAILDITGVPIVDSDVAESLLRAVRAARLVGAEVVLTGVRADVARTLVSLGVELGGVATLGTLKAGVAYAQRALRRAGNPAL